MKTRANFVLPDEKQKKLNKAIRLEWITIFFLLTITAVMYYTMGASQAMKTAWIEDILSLIPPISFLVAMRYRDREPTERFPYGFRRSTLLSFLVAAVAILILGLYMLYDSSMALLKQHHPTLGHFNLFGWKLWAGWVMIAALTYSMIPPVILGRMKLPLAKEVHEKTLHADATMNKADWMTAGAAILGILGLGLGFWWADAVAAGIISLDVLKDGITNVKGAMSDLMDQRPTGPSSGEPLDLDKKIKGKVRQFSGISDVGIRLREEGHIISGEIFVVFAKGAQDPEILEKITNQATELDWRLHNLVVVPVSSIDRL